ncbi:MAG: Crp/Fnr family transcriptional regulator [Muribaculaceae bacterium]|nr:Crp/Fnr family transcriptional regulator [Muribaculaceae bacterium]
MRNISKLIELVSEEAKIRISDEIWEELFSYASLRTLKRKEAMIDAGEYDPDVYFVKSGLVRGTFMDSTSERTAGFALPGTLLISFHCFYGGDASYYRFEACVPSQVVRIPSAVFRMMTEKYHEFALWVMEANQNQLYHAELKNRLISGDAKERLRQLIEGWPEIILKVSARHLASYLGISEVHLSRIKSEILREGVSS